MEEKLYTVMQAADYLGVDRATLYAWMRKGELSWVTVGSRRRITETELKRIVRPGNVVSDQENTEKNIEPVLAA